MRRRPLGRTGFEVSELALGTWGLSGDAYGAVAERDQEAVIDRALALGINVFDTADVYGSGSMERKLGARLPEQDTVVVTKIGTALDSNPARKRFDVEHLRRALGESQSRLGRKQVDVVLLHNPSVAAVQSEVAAAFLQSRVDDGTVAAWGISAGSAAVVTAALSANLKPAVVELAYNLFFPQDLQSLGGTLSDAKVGVIARSVLAHGLLAGHWALDTRFDEGDHRRERWTPQQLRRRLGQLVALTALDRERSPSMRAGAVNWVLCNELISTAVLGPRSVLQLDQLVREVRHEPPYLQLSERTRLAQRLAELKVT